MERDELPGPIGGTEASPPGAGGVGRLAGVSLLPESEAAVARIEGAECGAPRQRTDGETAARGRRAGGLLHPHEAGREVPGDIGSFVRTLSE